MFLSPKETLLLPIMSENDHVHRFMIECYKICCEAEFVIAALPEAEHSRVEGSARQLDAVRAILENIDDEYCDDETLEEMSDYVSTLLFKLEDFIDNPPASVSTSIPRVHTGRAGRPAYDLDLRRALLLHDLGNSWKDVADAMGVARSTLYNHLDRAGLTSARKEWTDITDDELDEHVAKFSIDHPFSGCTIVMGHLEGIGIHLPRLRIQQSLKRVDEIGVLTRYA